MPFKKYLKHNPNNFFEHTQIQYWYKSIKKHANS